MEKILVQGYIGNDAKSKETNGVEFTYFSVAVSKRFKKADGTVKEKTNWYAVYKSISKLDQYLKKGVAVIIEGDFSAEINVYEGKSSIAYSINNPKIYFSLGNRKPEEATTENTSETTTVENNNQTISPNVHFDGIPPETREDNIRPETEDDLPF